MHKSCMHGAYNGYGTRYRAAAHVCQSCPLCRRADPPTRCMDMGRHVDIDADMGRHVDIDAHMGRHVDFDADMEDPVYIDIDADMDRHVYIDIEADMHRQVDIDADAETPLLPH